jgi:hypothetical protein
MRPELALEEAETIFELAASPPLAISFACVEALTQTTLDVADGAPWSLFRCGVHCVGTVLQGTYADLSFLY